MPVATSPSSIICSIVCATVHWEDGGGSIPCVDHVPVNGSADGSSGNGLASANGRPSRPKAKHVSLNVVAALSGSPDARFPRFQMSFEIHCDVFHLPAEF